MPKFIDRIIEYILFILLMLFSFILAFSGNFSYAVTDGIKLWFACVLPSLFPYLFITYILSNLNVTNNLSKKLSPLTKRVFNTNGSCGYALFISIISGYPLGAKTVSELKNNNLLTDAESVRASAFCATSSPMFLISSVGTIMFSNFRFGLSLFFTNVISAIVVGFIFSFYKRNEKGKDKPVTITSTQNLLYNGVYSSVISVLVVGGLITLFYCLVEILLHFNVLSPLISGINVICKDEHISKSIVFGLFECTRGLSELSTAPFTLFTLPISSAICGFGGLSVIMQSIAYLKNAKIKTAPFLLSRLLSAVINFIFGLIFSVIFFY